METVIIVHGTWASPETTKDCWYYPSECLETEGFVAKLNAALQKRGSIARCWAHCREGSNQFFQWSGENSWVNRTRAADALGDYVAKLRKEGWRCHIVAHSHGGNVVLDALPKLMADSDSSALLGRLVTLGTPFMDTMTPVLGKVTRRQDALLCLAWLLFGYWLLLFFLSLGQRFSTQLPVSTPFTVIWLALSTLIFGALIFRWSKDRLKRMKLSTYLKENWQSLALEIGFWTLAGILLSDLQRHVSIANAPALLYIYEPFGTTSIAFMLIVLLLLFLARRKGWWSDHAKLLKPESVRPSPPLLAIGSRMDEAWQVLHHMRNATNPLAVKSNLFLYLLSSLRSSFAQRAAADRLYYGSFRDIGYKAALGAAATWAFFSF